MSRTHYGNINLQIPDDWEDASIITLLPPTPESFSMLTTKGVGQQQPNLVIRRQSFSGEAPDLEAFANAQEQMMRQLTEDVKVLSRETLTLSNSGRPSILREFSFRAEPSYIQQLHVYFVVDQQVLTACGTGAADASFGKLRTSFLDLLHSIELGDKTG